MYRRWLMNIDQDRTADFYFAEISSNAFSFAHWRDPGTSDLFFLSASSLHLFLPPFALPLFVSSISTSMHIYFISRVRAVEKDRSLASRRFDLNERTASVQSDGGGGGVPSRSAARKAIEEAEIRVRNVFADVDNAWKKSSRSLDFRKTYRKRDTPPSPALPSHPFSPLPGHPHSFSHECVSTFPKLRV